VFFGCGRSRRPTSRAHGDGLSLPLDQFAFSALAPRIAFAPAPADDAGGVAVRHPVADTTHILSLHPARRSKSVTVARTGFAHADII